MNEQSDLDVSARREVAADTLASPAQLAELALDAHTGVRATVAGNPSCPPNSLRILAQDSSEWVRGAVAANPNVPDDIAEKLAFDTAWFVRAQVGEYARLTPQMAQTLAQDLQIDVIRALANSRYLSTEAISGIRESEDELAIGNLATNQSLDDAGVLELLPLVDSWRRQEIAKRDAPSLSLQEVLCRDEDEHVRAAVAANPDLDPGLMKSLASDPDEDVRTAVHRNPASDEDTRAIAALLGVQKRVSLHD